MEDAGLLAEVAGLVEWPVVLMGSFDEAFLAIPPEVIRTTIRNNQKCFVLRDPKTAQLANKFILVANIEAEDGGKAIVAGNERVIRARLSDAKFFYETDLKTRLEDRLAKFKHIVFHEKLGTQAERIERIEQLAAELAPIVGADVEKAKRAARLAKADLLTEVVGEFPELQGLMGKYYALAQGEDASVAAASEEHYKPLGPGDRVPTDPVPIAVALADKIDTLVGFWAIDEKPTGSKDPYALRRAALGVIRIALSGKHDLVPRSLLEMHIKRVRSNLSDVEMLSIGDSFEEFFDERLKVQLREQGARHDLVDAVLHLRGRAAGIVSIVRRVEALGKVSRYGGWKKSSRRLQARHQHPPHRGEEGRTCLCPSKPDPAFYRQDEERALAKAIDIARNEAGAAVAREDFEAAMRAMAKLRPHVDAFFDKVTVNVADGADKEKLRENRLKLLNEIREATRTVADFSRIEG